MDCDEPESRSMSRSATGGGIMSDEEHRDSMLQLVVVMGTTEFRKEL